MATEKVSTVLFLLVAMCVISMGGILLIVYLVDGGNTIVYTQPAPVSYVRVVPQQVYVSDVQVTSTTLAQKPAYDKLAMMQRQINYLEDENMYLNSRYNTLSREIDDEDYYHHDDNNDEADLTVYVEDEDGDDIEDAKVRIQDGDDDIDYTNENGKAVFYNIDPDCYDVTVTKSGYFDEETSICLDDGESRGITVEMEED